MKLSVNEVEGCQEQDLNPVKSYPADGGKRLNGVGLQFVCASSGTMLEPI